MGISTALTVLSSANKKADVDDLYQLVSCEKLAVVESMDLVSTRFVLFQDEGERWGVSDLMAPKQKPIFVDFLDSNHRQKQKIGFTKRDLLVRAMGGMRDKMVVFDATCGFAEDSFSFLLMGAEVFAVERNPLVHFLVRDAVRRACKDDQMSVLFKKFHLQQGDSGEVLKKSQSLGKKYDTIFIDPMFSKEKLTAQPHKSTQFLRTFIEAHKSGEEIVGIALQSRCDRVVVKRHISNPPIHEKVIHQFKGKSVRYDMYKPGVGQSL